MRLDIKKKTLINLYVKEKLTDKQIAKKLGCCQISIFRHRKKFGIVANKEFERKICKPTKRQLEVIYGSLFGDGHLARRHSKYQNSEFEVGHCIKQKEYVEWKYDILKSLCNSGVHRRKNLYRMRTFSHPVFTSLRDIWYDHKSKKRINKAILERITPLTLAVWYMDDGSIAKKSGTITLHTCCFSASEHILIIKYLKKKFGIDSYVRWASGYRNLIIALNSRQHFINIIKKYIHPSLNYKIKRKSRI